jgi:hypothetical protein
MSAPVRENGGSGRHFFTEFPLLMRNRFHMAGNRIAQLLCTSARFENIYRDAIFSLWRWRRKGFCPPRPILQFAQIAGLRGNSVLNSAATCTSRVWKKPMAGQNGAASQLLPGESVAY